jgi:site-specific DNA-cytosine methylase
MDGEMSMRVLDLFSGLGGFSEAFLRSGDEVVRVENNPLLSEVPNTTMQDVIQVRDRLSEFVNQGMAIRDIDVVLASPPCHEFSLAFSAPQAIASRRQEFDEYEPDMSLIEATLEIIEMVKPKFWIIENVRGSIRHFRKLGLEPQVINDAYVFYGKFPKFGYVEIPTKQEKDTHKNDPLRSNRRALIPLPLSIAIRRAIVEQTSLFDFA